MGMGAPGSAGSGGVDGGASGGAGSAGSRGGAGAGSSVKGGSGAGGRVLLRTLLPPHTSVAGALRGVIQTLGSRRSKRVARVMPFLGVGGLQDGATGTD